MDYQIIRSARRTLSLEITREGKVILRCPHRTSRQEITRFLSEKEHWLMTHLQQLESRPKEPPLTQSQLAALKQQAKDLFPQEVAALAQRLNIRYGRVTVRAQKSRWGSCSREGNISLNCLLLLVPEEVRTYVMVHELCHRKYMDHSAAFWKAVEEAFPDYRIPRKWLQENGRSLIARIP